MSGTCDYRNVDNCQGLEWRRGAIVDVASYVNSSNFSSEFIA